MFNYLFNVLILPVLNERGDGGGGGDNNTTTIIEQPKQTPEEIALQQKQNELIQAQLEEAKRQNEIMAKFAPLYEQQMKQQADIYQQQMAQQQKAYDELSKALQPTEAELKNQQIEQELLSRQLGYAKGEMAALSESESKALDEMIGIQKQIAAENIIQKYKQGAMGAKEAAIGRGLGSSSIRESWEDELKAQLIGEAGAAEQQLEGAKYQASWQMPQAKQIFDTGMSQFQQALNQQAEANRQRFYGSLTTGVGSPFESLGSFMGMSVPGTYFGSEGDANAGRNNDQRSRSAEDSLKTVMPWLFNPMGAIGREQAAIIDPGGTDRYYGWNYGGKVYGNDESRQTSGFFGIGPWAYGALDD